MASNSVKVLIWTFAYIGIFQIYVSVAFPSSYPSDMESWNSTYALNTVESQLHKRNGAFTVYTVKALFLIDGTPKSEEEAERRRLHSMLQSVNTKLRTTGAFNSYYFQIEPTKVYFQETIFENNHNLAPVLEKWMAEYPNRYSNEEVDAGMLLTRLGNLQRLKALNFRKPPIAELKEIYKKIHSEIYNLNPWLYQATADPDVLAPIIDPTKQYIHPSPSNPSNGGRPRPSNPPNPSGTAQGNTRKRKKNNSGEHVIIGVTAPNSLCHHRATGVMSSYGDEENRHAFESIFIHELFHGFGIAHDPEFKPKCSGFVMEDGISGDPPLQFSPCSKAAMDILIQSPDLKCIKDSGVIKAN